MQAVVGCFQENLRKDCVTLGRMVSGIQHNSTIEPLNGLYLGGKNGPRLKLWWGKKQQSLILIRMRDV